jgi:DNA-binding LacI/PurR family transcriptional regulator
MKKYKYQKLAEQLENEICNNYSPGQLFPAEEKLCKRFGFNRSTVHKAILALADKGLLRCEGRKGTFVTDFVNTGFDSRLVGVVMPLRSHIWDRLFLDISCACTEHSYFPFSIDTTAVTLEESGAEKRMWELLSKSLRFRPRNLIVSSTGMIDDFLKKLGKDRRLFRNLIWLSHFDSSSCKDPCFVRICADMDSTWSLLAEDAIKCGYKRIAVFSHENSEIWQSLADKAKEILNLHGQKSPEVHCFSAENLQQSLNGLVQLARASSSLAILCTNDYAAHLSTGALRAAGISIPDQVGIYGANNTPWAEKDNLTTVDFSASLWSKEIIKYISSRKQNSPRHIAIPPRLIHRGSSMRRR